MKLGKDYRKVNELLSQANEINGKLIDLNDTRSDHSYSLKANADNDIWINDYHNGHVSKLTESIKVQESELLQQLWNIKRQILGI